MATITLSRVPPWLQHTVLSRGEWNSWALERSLLGPMHDPTPTVPFHHLAVRLDRAPMRMRWTIDGRRSDTDLPLDHVSIIPTDVSLTSWWNRPVDVACLYFMPQALETALGKEVFASSRWELRPSLAMRAPTIAGLIRSLTMDAQMSQPYGRMRGEALFQQLATLLVADGRLLKNKQYKAGIGDRRVRRALDYIHAHFGDELDLERISQASETSPFYLTRLFRQATGYPVWRYVSRLRVTVAEGLMKDATLTLTDIAELSGFASYATFAATFSAERGTSPSHFRKYR